MQCTKNITGIQYSDFIDYRAGKSSGDLDLLSTVYWKSLEDVLTNYIRHDDCKFDYVDGIAYRKRITTGKIRYTRNESNNLGETVVTGITEDDSVEY